MPDHTETPAWQVAIFGTFDVENYGDLLFPIIAEAELSRRLGTVKLHRFSYNAKSTAEWPYNVTSLTELPVLAEQLDAVLIGGGFIVRFDKVVADGYLPPTPAIHHPTGYWLTPALIAQQHGVPVIWNVPGMHCNDIPEWGSPLLRMALEQSQCVRVRDEPSRESLSAISPSTDIQVLPDTAFSLPNLIDEQQPSATFNELRQTFGLDVPYIVIQPIHVVEPFLQLFEQYPQVLSGYRLLVLPIGPVLGDHAKVVSVRIPDAITLPFWPAPLLLAEILCHAQAVIGHSYHLSISALVFGVPVFSTADLSTGKYTALAEMGQMHALPSGDALTEQWFRSRIGKTSAPAAIKAAKGELATYWDHVASIINEGKTSASHSLNRFWQHLPTLLEEGVAPHPVEPTTLKLDHLNIELNARQRQIFQLTEQLVTLQSDSQRQVSQLTEQLVSLHGDSHRQVSRLTEQWAILQRDSQQQISQLAEQFVTSLDASQRQASQLAEQLAAIQHDSQQQIAQLTVQHAAQLSDSRRQIAELTVRHTAQLSDSERQLSQLIEQHGMLQSDRERQLSQANEQHATLQNSSQRQLLQLTEQLATLQNSHSFKLTAPLRSLRRMFKKTRTD